jgi:hypothetical protein
MKIYIMKKNYIFTLVMTFCIIGSSFGQVSLPHYDGFDYAVGADLGAQTNWENFSGTANEIDAVSGSLSYEGLESSTGNSVYLEGASYDSQILFSEVTSGEVFSSFIIKVTDISNMTDYTDGGYFAIFASGTTSFNARLWAHPATNPVGSTFDFAITNANSGSGFGADYNVDDEILIVMSYNTTSGVMNAWINPSSSDFEGSTVPTATLTDTDATPNATNRFILRQDSNGETPGMIIDELRLGTTWASVTPAAAAAALKNNTTEGFSTYPNPITNNVFTITSNSTSKKEFAIFNLLGKQVLSSSFASEKSNVDVSTISAGIYILKVTEAGKTASKKLVIR